MLPPAAAFRSFHGRVVFHRVYAPRLLCPSADRHVGFLLALATMNTALQWFLNEKKILLWNLIKGYRAETAEPHGHADPGL